MLRFDCLADFVVLAAWLCDFVVCGWLCFSWLFVLRVSGCVDFVFFVCVDCWLRATNFAIALFGCLGLRLRLCVG